VKKFFLATIPALLVTAFVWTIGNILINPEEPKKVAEINITSTKTKEMKKSSTISLSETPAPGKKQAKKCKACHSLSKDKKVKIGPPLWGIVGSKKAQTVDFKYSKKLQSLGGVWSEEELSKFIQAPNKYAPGTKMLFKGIKDDQDRKNLIIFLKTLTDQ
jgi:cytochrome c|tara:strand:- start:387 stop:866 length:480 start_codon:yes stop_codon:yes gene_type:complete